jgi:predicted AAA+ superfamily ATPase
MERDIYHRLIEWKQSELRKPLILRGARQVGKTYSLLAFAATEYADVVHINFDEEPSFIEFFALNLNPDRILKDLTIHFKKPLNPGTTLIILDEIQLCPNALNSLKYFCEKRNEYHIVAAGSLLGVKLAKGFPVGKVNFLDMTPLTFFEFLNAMGESSLLGLLKELVAPHPILAPFHDKLINLLRYYFVIGGMPEAIATYLKTDSLIDVRRVQKEILDAYTLDFAKHAPKEELMKIMTVWEMLPSQLAKENKKFVFSAIRKSARGRDYENSIQWLVDAGLIIKSQLLKTPRLPLTAYKDHSAFKIYTLDVGLLSAMSKLDPSLVLEANTLFVEFKGALTENFVAQELRQQHFDSLYYWTSNGEAEVDFIVSAQQKIYPLEVKSGSDKQKKSLVVYGNKYSSYEYQASALSRATLRNFAHDGKIVNYPLYAIALFPRLAQE